jgi:hypothetical protein
MKRRKKERKPPKQQVNIRLELDQISLLRALSIESNITVTAIVSVLINDYLKVYNYTKNNGTLNNTSITKSITNGNKI